MEFNFLTYSDSGKSKVLTFELGGKYYRQEYKYGNGYGVKFIYEYPSLECLNNRLSMVGGRIIYSSALQSDCTDFGRELEYKLFKMGNPEKLIPIIN